jgi:hypothetical protein
VGILDLHIAALSEYHLLARQCNLKSAFDRNHAQRLRIDGFALATEHE